MRTIRRALGAVAVAGALAAATVPARAQDAGAGQPAQREQQPVYNGQRGQVVIGTEGAIDPNQPIKVGFTISVQVQSAAGPEADLSGNMQVDPAGNIQMKLAGPVQIKGLTPTQAADKIAVALRPYIKEPKVSVSIISTPKPTIIVGGAIAQTGPVLITDNTSLAEVLAVIAPIENADLARVVVTSTDDKGARTSHIYNFMRWMKPAPGQAPDESQNPVLTDRDFVYVPPKNAPNMGTVTVEGAVVHQGLVDTRYGVPLKLREAISLSGGVLPTADRQRVYVRRQTQESPLIVNYDRLESNDPADNVDLLPGDVVYVETLGFNEFINMNGAFVRAGKLPYTRAMTLTQAVGEASGLQPVAKEKEGRIYRHIAGNADPTRTQIIAFNYLKVRKGQQPDILLEPGDTVEMPIGFGPRPPMTPLETTQALLSIVYIIHAIVNPNGTGF